jgi:hypothetical protein
MGEGQPDAKAKRPNRQKVIVIEEAELDWFTIDQGPSGAIQVPDPNSVRFMEQSAVDSTDPLDVQFDVTALGLANQGERSAQGLPGSTQSAILDNQFPQSG